MKTMAQPPAAAYDGPPDYRVVGRHAVFPETTHDEIERINFLAQLNRHLSTRVVPGVAAAYDARVRPALRESLGREPEDRHEVRHALLGESVFRTWSALRRLTMEQRQQAGRWTVLRQAEALAARAAALTADDPRLQLDPA